MSVELVWTPVESGNWPAVRDGGSARLLGGGDPVVLLPLGAVAPFVEGFRALYRADCSDDGYQRACVNAVQRCGLDDEAFCRRTGVATEALAELLAREPAAAVSGAPAATVDAIADAPDAAAAAAEHGAPPNAKQAEKAELVARFANGRQAVVRLACRGRKTCAHVAAAADGEGGTPLSRATPPLQLIGTRVLRLWSGVGLRRGRVVGASSRDSGGGSGGTGVQGAFTFEVRFEHGESLAMTYEEVKAMAVLST